VSPAGADRRPVAIALAIVAAVVALDQLTKTWAVRELGDGPVSVVGDFAELRLSFNPGASFSLLTGRTPILAVLAIVIAGALVWVLVRTDSLGMAVGFGLVLGGALGNLADRIFRAPRFLHGEVVDFVSVGAWPTFNVADSAITIGAILVIWFAWRADRESDRSDQPDPR